MRYFLGIQIGLDLAHDSTKDASRVFVFGSGARLLGRFKKLATLPMIHERAFHSFSTWRPPAYFQLFTRAFLSFLINAFYAIFSLNIFSSEKETS